MRCTSGGVGPERSVPSAGGTSAVDEADQAVAPDQGLPLGDKRTSIIRFSKSHFDPQQTCIWTSSDTPASALVAHVSAANIGDGVENA